ncbi:nitrate/nitrite two-component system sensor histidine kinase NarQ [Lonepinella koalarum]|uniref:nitrate/nitrite two-component system sensor histidine kinase NarQ n=1 Tax=Lonepinella koalarum TaxID=53417 RepID=UPI00104CC52F|nr:nitrate/nitrite two-component system sensor histidine kinase NarQ [Lonepinella koalarum]TFJ91184.1 nitrate/nitrite two-component system sensor histidine kinase NarQ [Lonepinella koalarum]TYG35626.1 nitrate/nitrite two-component system sensor histidine kinase NarQ [Lonepinella koalarum]
MNKKTSVSSSVSNYLLAVMGFVSIIAAVAFAIMASNRSDAEVINVAGSLRMQSYRILHELQYEPEQVKKHLIEYRKTLHASSLRKIDQQFITPDSLKYHYDDLIRQWQKLEYYALHQNQQAYRQELVPYVGKVDNFVFALQQFAEKKLIYTTAIIVISLLAIVIMVAYIISFMRTRIVTPLRQLTDASVQIQMRQFQHIPLDIYRNDELGSLAQAFTQMSSELSKVYSNLEQTLDDKTQKLIQTNRTLAMLYYCSQTLTLVNIDREHLRSVLQNVMATEHLRVLELEIIGAEHWNILLGEPLQQLTWQMTDIEIEGQQLGVLRWQAGLPCPDPRTMQNIAQIFARTLYFHQTQRQQQQLLLMEERSIIARELHDSLAQVLSFLQIQLTLLKHSLAKDSEQAKAKSQAILTEFEQALSDGCLQLRELLATFRLTVQEANLKLALEQVIDSLRNQTESHLSVACSLPSQTFTPQQLIHALQIVREATLNAVKHAKAKHIEIIAHTNIDGEQELLVRDDGIGIPSLEEPEGHYGLRIMEERSRQLNATLTITNRTSGGTEVKILLPNIIKTTH